MAAGLGFKDFTTGEVLTAADVDGYLMQGIWVFASAAARDAAVTSPQEGNACYLKDTNQVLTYSGSAWVAVGGGSSPLTTKGDLYGFSTVDARIPIGANNTVLTADSTQALGLKWATPASGKVLQVVQTVKTDTFTSTSTSFIDITGLSVSITPSSASSKVLVLVSLTLTGTFNATVAVAQLLRGGTTIYAGDASGSRSPGFASNMPASTDNVNVSPGIYLDSPATTSSTTYKIQGLTSTGTFFVNRTSGDANASYTVRGVSSITAIEIGA
jgi:hypothetical protein